MPIVQGPTIQGPRQASWRDPTPGNEPSLHKPAYDSGVNSLYQWGPLQFEQYPLNVEALEHETATDWAKKPIVGAAIYREWVGEQDEVVNLHGTLFPYRIGGMSEIELFNAMRRAAMANILVRGKGEILGWFVCERLVRSHTFLSSEGVGQKIVFEAMMVRVPVPAADEYQAQIWQTMSGRT